MPHFLSQSSLAFHSASSKSSYPSTSLDTTAHHHHRRAASHSLPQYFSPSVHYNVNVNGTNSNNNSSAGVNGTYHHLHSYPNDSTSSSTTSSHLYSTATDHSMLFNPTYSSSYDPNNNHYSDYHSQHHYALHRTSNESEHYSNYYSSPGNIDPRHYTDLTARTTDKHYEMIHHRSNLTSQDNTENDLVAAGPSATSVVLNNHDNDYQWNSTATSTNGQW